MSEYIKRKYKMDNTFINQEENIKPESEEKEENILDITKNATKNMLRERDIKEMFIGTIAFTVIQLLVSKVSGKEVKITETLIFQSIAWGLHYSLRKFLAHYI